MSTPAVVPPTVRAADRLASLERIIERGLSEFVEVGRALATIQREQLYLSSHRSFAAYLRERFDLGQQSAYQKIYAARAADAITSSGARLPAGIAQEAMRPLVPLLNQSGPEAVGRAWRIVEQQRGDAHRAPSAGDVRAALQDAGMLTAAAPKPKANRLEPIADRLRTAIKRVESISEQLDGRPLPPGTRKRAGELAGLARQLASALDALADATGAAALLQALEVGAPRAPEPVAQLAPKPENDPLADLCIGHGIDRDDRGVCVLCRRPDRPRPGFGSRALDGQAA